MHILLTLKRLTNLGNFPFKPHPHIDMPSSLAPLSSFSAFAVTFTLDGIVSINQQSHTDIINSGDLLRFRRTAAVSDGYDRILKTSGNAAAHHLNQTPVSAVLDVPRQR